MLTVPLISMPLFGYWALGSIMGAFLTMVSLGSMASGSFANLLYDRLDSYTPVFRLGCID